MKRKGYTVYTIRLATELMKRGFRILHTEPDKRNPKYNVFFFEYSDELVEAINELK